MPEPKRPLKVFLCHAHADRDAVRGLYTRLTQDGVDAWLDKAKLLPGQDWELEIRKAVREADVVVVCLSKQFNQAGFRQKEVRLALDTAMEKPEGEIFIIPARLEECDNLESLRKWHWVDLFEDDGYEMLVRALQLRADRIGAKLQVQKSGVSVNASLHSKIEKPEDDKAPFVPIKDKLEKLPASSVAVANSISDSVISFGKQVTSPPSPSKEFTTKEKQVASNKSIETKKLSPVAPRPQNLRLQSGLNSNMRLLLALGSIAIVIVLVLFWVLSKSGEKGGLPADISVDEAYALYQQGAFILDVRTIGEWDEYHIPNSTLIPLDQLSSRVDELPNDGQIVIVDRTGNRSIAARDILIQNSFTNTTSMSGGLEEWQTKGYPTVNGP